MFFQVVSTHQRRRTIGFVKAQNFLRYGDVFVGGVELLGDAPVTKYRANLGRKQLPRTGCSMGSGFSAMKARKFSQEVGISSFVR
jgi:hypothetical protein